MTEFISKECISDLIKVDLDIAMSLSLNVVTEKLHATAMFSWNLNSDEELQQFLFSWWWHVVNVANIFAEQLRSNLAGMQSHPAAVNFILLRSCSS